MLSTKFSLYVILLLFFVESAYQNGTEITFKNLTVKVKVYGEENTKKYEVRLDSLPNTTSILNLLNLEHVDVFQIKNEDLPVLYNDSVINFFKLHKLILSSNGIKEIQPGAFKNFTKVTDVILSHNNLEHISDGTFSNLEIRNLYLDGNKIKKIDSYAFNNMTILYQIDLKNNKLYNWDSSWFLGSPPQHLDFSKNRIELLPEGAFGYFRQFRKSLRNEFYYINLSNNKLSYIHPKSLPEVPVLWFLYLEHNDLRGFENGTFDGIKRLEYLRLGHNRIKQFPNYLLSQTEVKVLTLDGNLIESIDVNITEIIDLNDNPLDTSCRNMWEKRKAEEAYKFEEYNQLKR